MRLYNCLISLECERYTPAKPGLGPEPVLGGHFFVFYCKLIMPQCLFAFAQLRRLVTFARMPAGFYATDEFSNDHLFILFAYSGMGNRRVKLRSSFARPVDPMVIVSFRRALFPQNLLPFLRAVLNTLASP